MRNLTVLLLAFVFLCSVTYAVEIDPSKFMTVDEIKPGMKGVGKTVFEGTRIDEFQVEVLDIVRGTTSPKGDIIWVLCSGGPLGETGVLSGMSGSPVYIDGRLIGAIAYRLASFSKRPIAGITPIANMLSAMEKGEKSNGPGGLGKWSSEELDSILHGNMGKWESEKVGRWENGVVPIQTPVVMAGFHPEAIKDIAPVLEDFGMVAVQVGGSSADPGDFELAPGAVVGVQFMRGDLTLFASGTVTYVDGNKFLGFGHSIANMGTTNLPMSGGRVSLLISSLMSSAKYTTPAETLGTWVYDDDYAIMGVFDEQPDFIPVKIRIGSEWRSQYEEYNFEVAKHKLFAPTYIRAAATSAIYNAEKMIGDYTMRTHSEIKLKGYPAISKDNAFSGSSPGVVASSFAAPLYALMQNTFEEADIESVSLEISFEYKRTTAQIDGVRINRNTVRPGDSVEVTVFLTPYMGDTVTRIFEVTIPEDTPEGRSLLRISDADSSYSWERSRAPMKARIADLPYLIQVIREEESNNDIIVELFAPKVGVTIGNQELPALPLTTFSVMSSRKQSGGSGLTRGTTFMKQRVSTDYVISGGTVLLLIIDRDATY